MKNVYIFEYVNESEFNKLERSLKKYNMLAYKKLYFEYYPKLKEGELQGNIVGEDPEKGSISYEVNLPTDALFKKVHGPIKLHYYFFEKENVVMMNTITPEKILTEGHQSELETHKGVMVSKDNADKDKFKINLLNMINNK